MNNNMFCFIKDFKKNLVNGVDGIDTIDISKNNFFQNLMGKNKDDEYFDKLIEMFITIPEVRDRLLIEELRRNLSGSRKNPENTMAVISDLKDKITVKKLADKKEVVSITIDKKEKLESLIEVFNKNNFGVEYIENITDLEYILRNQIETTKKTVFLGTLESALKENLKAIIKEDLFDEMFPELEDSDLIIIEKIDNKDKIKIIKTNINQIIFEDFDNNEKILDIEKIIYKKELQEQERIQNKKGKQEKKDTKDIKVEKETKSEKKDEINEEINKEEKKVEKIKEDSNKK